MRKFLFPIFMLYCSVAPGQTTQQEPSAIQCSAGIGVDGFSSQSVFSYVNTLFGVPSTQTLSGLIPASEFFIVPEFQIADHWLLGVEYSYLSCSKSVSGYYEGEFSETIHMPSVIVHYGWHGEGYWLKLGGGAGYQVATLTQTFTQIGSERTSMAHGIGVKLDAMMNLAFDEHWYGMLSGDVRWGIGGTFSNQGTDVSYQSVSPQLNFVTVGLKLGMMYQF